MGPTPAPLNGGGPLGPSPGPIMGGSPGMGGSPSPNGNFSPSPNGQFSPFPNSPGQFSPGPFSPGMFSPGQSPPSGPPIPTSPACASAVTDAKSAVALDPAYYNLIPYKLCANMGMFPTSCEVNYSYDDCNARTGNGQDFCTQDSNCAWTHGNCASISLAAACGAISLTGTAQACDTYRDPATNHPVCVSNQQCQDVCADCADCLNGVSTDFLPIYNQKFGTNAQNELAKVKFSSNVKLANPSGSAAPTSNPRDVFEKATTDSFGSQATLSMADATTLLITLDATATVAVNSTLTIKASSLVVDALTGRNAVTAGAVTGGLQASPNPSTPIAKIGGPNKIGGSCPGQTSRFAVTFDGSASPPNAGRPLTKYVWSAAPGSPAALTDAVTSANTAADSSRLMLTATQVAALAGPIVGATAGTVYQFTLTASLDVPGGAQGAAVTTTVSLTAASTPVVAVLNGPRGDVLGNTNITFTSASVDPDADTSAAFQYTFTCDRYNAARTTKLPCFPTGVTPYADIASGSYIFPAALVVADAAYIFEIGLTASKGARSDTDKAVIRVLPVKDASGNAIPVPPTGSTS
ncbi:hypothetical protein WJX72_007824 [[Myrmecia] bisecta]|uniref:Uncharacterized protein n=1 Tax=[Myrmecia] bisecta TaxID=41462 RepID=A0AAW1QRB4_9CHLO